MIEIDIVKMCLDFLIFKEFIKCFNFELRVRYDIDYVIW